MQYTAYCCLFQPVNFLYFFLFICLSWQWLTKIVGVLNLLQMQCFDKFFQIYMQSLWSWCKGVKTLFWFCCKVFAVYFWVENLYATVKMKNNLNLCSFYILINVQVIQDWSSWCISANPHVLSGRLPLKLWNSGYLPLASPLLCGSINLPLLDVLTLTNINYGFVSMMRVIITCKSQTLWN